VDRLSLTTITEALRALAVSDVTTNKQWRQFSTIITRLPPWLATLLIRLPCFIPELWVKYRGGAVLISSPAKYGVDVVVGDVVAFARGSFGLVKPRPVVRDTEIVACTTFALTLNFDRRVMAVLRRPGLKRIVDLLQRRNPNWHRIRHGRPDSSSADPGGDPAWTPALHLEHHGHCDPHRRCP